MSDFGLDLRVGEPPPLPVEATRHYPTHPLFPLPEGVHETKEIHEITFDRWNDRGIKERCPDRFRASELTSLAQVVDMFGGGTYQFIAFDSRGNFSRWTPEKEKVRIELPSKPFRHIERPAPELTAEQPARAGSAQADLLALLLQQTTAAQERADRLMAVLIERIAQQATSPPLPPPPPPPMDPLAMLTALATVLEKLRPAQSSDNLTQLSGLVSVLKQLSGTQPAESSADDLLGAMASMMKAAPAHAAAPQPAASPPAPRAPIPPPTPPDLLWVMVPNVGPVLMRPDQVARFIAQTATQPPASTTAPTPQPITPKPASPPAAAPTPAPTTTTPPSPPAPTPAPTPTPAAPSSAAPKPTHERTERCIICNEGGVRDPASPEILICRNNHRSLLKPRPPQPARAAPPTSPAGPPTQSEVDALLADPEVLQALTPEAIAALRLMSFQKAQP